MSAVGAFDSNFRYVACIDTHLNRREWGSLNVEGRNREHGSNGRNQNRVLSHGVFSHLRRSRQYKRAFTLRAMVSNLTSNDNLASIPIVGLASATSESKPAHQLLSLTHDGNFPLMGFADVAEQQNCGIKEVSLVLIALGICACQNQSASRLPGGSREACAERARQEAPDKRPALISKEPAGSSTALV
jgi:hypothetical protein